ncbi:alpha/beta hydrolase [Roseinatronobacter sp.]|uniref:alpha/beta hydrolase n=1 Tax=Roseinatronobacter sp. TaxID=1945755 RepID=UPI003F71EED1
MNATSRVPDFTLDQTARDQLAQELRANSLIETRLTPDMEADLAKVDVIEEAVPTRAGKTRVLHITPRDRGRHDRPLFINVHGGGFVRGYQHRDTVFCAHLATMLDCVVIDIDYRLAPEHPFPVALHEVYDVTAWAFANASEIGVDASRIALGGHSAGGNLTASVAMLARSGKSFALRAIVMDYPFLDGATPPEKKIEPASLFPVERLHAFNVLYAGDPENLSDSLLSPVLAPVDALVGLPPSLIITAGRDILRHEARRFAAMLVEAGCDVSVRNFADADHGFIIAAQRGHRDGRAAIVDFLAAQFRAAACHVREE